MERTTKAASQKRTSMQGVATAPFFAFSETDHFRACLPPPCRPAVPVKCLAITLTSCFAESSQAYRSVNPGILDLSSGDQA